MGDQTTTSNQLPQNAIGRSDTHEGIWARLEGEVSSGISTKSVLLVGAGSGGSNTAELLVRSGVQNLTVIDPDAVGPENLSRTVYVAADIGTLKVNALGQRLSAINSSVEYHAVPRAIQDIGFEGLDHLIGSSDLVIAATDDPEAQYLLNHFAYARLVPAVFAGVYRRGMGGEVIFTIPTLTPCLRCCTPHRIDARRTGEMNYGTGRMQGEPALGADINHIVTASVKLAIGLLELTEEPNGSARELVMAALGRGCNYLQMSTTPGFFDDSFFKEARGQLAYQSLWWSAHSDPACPVCGGSPADPTSIMFEKPDTQELLSLFNTVKEM
ncbi:MAG: ThiF family adenylyltransferase [Eggerthellaceae bacterium]|nr:ThiF family adenylyltransferase [Eggerthellaceae bacterium]